MKTSPDNKQAASYRHTQQRINFTRKGLAEEVSKELPYCLNQHRNAIK